MVDTVTLQARLEEAETALHQLMVGAKSVRVSYDGQSVEYVLADTGRLRAYIAELKSQLGQTGGRTRARTVVA